MRVQTINFRNLLVTPLFVSYCPDKRVAISKCRHAALKVVRNKLNGALLYPANRITEEVYGHGNCRDLPGIYREGNNSEIKTFKMTFSSTS
jgi:hypothetical protein